MSEGLPFWDTAVNAMAWDTLILGGNVWPGVASLSGQGVSRDIDVKKAPGEDGATFTDKGYEPARLTARLLIYNWQDFAMLQMLLPDVHPRRKGGTTQPLDIYHPITALLGIQTVYVDKIPIVEHDKANGWISVELSMIEWMPAPKPKSPQGTPKSGESPDDLAKKALEAAQKVIEDMKNAGKEGWGGP